MLRASSPFSTCSARSERRQARASGSSGAAYEASAARVQITHVNKRVIDLGSKSPWRNFAAAKGRSAARARFWPAAVGGETSHPQEILVGQTQGCGRFSQRGTL